MVDLTKIKFPEKNVYHFACLLFFSCKADQVFTSINALLGNMLFLFINLLAVKKKTMFVWKFFNLSIIFEIQLHWHKSRLTYNCLVRTLKIFHLFLASICIKKLDFNPNIFICRQFTFYFSLFMYLLLSPFKFTTPYLSVNFFVFLYVLILLDIKSCIQEIMPFQFSNCCIISLTIASIVF